MSTPLWLRWKALRFPWRRQRFVGADLVGNTFWEFSDAINAGRMRRIVRSKPNVQFSDVDIARLSSPPPSPPFAPSASPAYYANGILGQRALLTPETAQWVQWLRHTRADPPSMEEQEMDKVRQVRLKELAAAADRRWAEKESLLVSPEKQNPLSRRELDLMGELKGGVVRPKESGTVPRPVLDREGESKIRGDKSHDPSQSPAVPGEGAAPESWSPTAVPRR